MSKTEQPLITIAIPCYNSIGTIENAVKSVFNQTYQNWELLLLDDGSADGTLELIRKIEDTRVTVIADNVNKGLVFRLNQVPALAKGDFIARMDSDDLMDPTRLTKQMAFLIQNPETDLVDSGLYIIDENEVPIGKRDLQDISYDPAQIARKSMLVHASILGKKQWFASHLYDGDFRRAEDYELWCRTFQDSKFARIKEPLYICREGRVNIKNYKRSQETIRKVLEKHGVNMLSGYELRKEIIKTYAKSLTYDVFGMLNLQNILTSKRNSGLGEKEVDHVQHLISDIRAVKINGW